jgi:hypothetical protein
LIAAQKSRRRRHKKPALRFDFVTPLCNCEKTEDKSKKNVFIFICVLVLLVFDAGVAGFCCVAGNE